MRNAIKAKASRIKSLDHFDNEIAYSATTGLLHSLARNRGNYEPVHQDCADRPLVQERVHDTRHRPGDVARGHSFWKSARAFFDRIVEHLPSCIRELRYQRIPRRRVRSAPSG